MQLKPLGFFHLITTFTRSPLNHHTEPILIAKKTPRSQSIAISILPTSRLFHKSSAFLGPHQGPKTPGMAASLAGKHCAIVGGTGVIGASIARAFAWRGAVTSVLGRRALQLRDEIEPLLRPYEPLPPLSPSHPRPELSRHRFIKLDVSQRESIKNVFASEITEVGGLSLPRPLPPTTGSPKRGGERIRLKTNIQRRPLLDQSISSSTAPAFLRPHS